MKITNISSVSDWFFRHDGTDGAPVVYQIAAWGLTDEGEVIGLVSAFGIQQGEQRRAPHLVAVPPVPGTYLHRDQLSQEEQEASKRR